MGRAREGGSGASDSGGRRERDGRKGFLASPCRSPGAHATTSHALCHRDTQAPATVDTRARTHATPTHHAKRQRLLGAVPLQQRRHHTRNQRVACVCVRHVYVFQEWGFRRGVSSVRFRHGEHDGSRNTYKAQSRIESKSLGLPK